LCRSHPTSSLPSQGMQSRLRWSLLGAALLIAPVTQAVPPPRRDWWVQGPGGAYGLIEIQQTTAPTPNSTTQPHTTVLLGPWRKTVPASAPQVVTIATLLTLITAFTWGWIRTRRR